MNAILTDIEEVLVKDCIEAAEQSTTKDWVYKTSINDIDIKIKGMTYGDYISFQRTQIYSVNIDSKFYKIPKKDIKEFSEKISNILYKKLNTI